MFGTAITISLYTVVFTDSLQNSLSLSAGLVSTNAFDKNIVPPCSIFFTGLSLTLYVCSLVLSRSLSATLSEPICWKQLLATAGKLIIMFFAEKLHMHIICTRLFVWDSFHNVDFYNIFQKCAYTFTHTLINVNINWQADEWFRTYSQSELGVQLYFLQCFQTLQSILRFNLKSCRCR